MQVNVPPPPESQPSAGEKTRVVRFEVSPATMIQLILALACVWLLIHLWPVLLVLVVALLIVGTMSPAVSWMEARGVKRGLGIAIVFTLLFVVATLAVTLTIPSLVAQASTLVEQEPLVSRTSFGLSRPLQSDRAARGLAAERQVRGFLD